MAETKKIEELSGLIPINKLVKMKFIIPSYQRGYRWTNQQVRDLLEDIWEFSQRKRKEENDFYCLQPVVVRKLIINNEVIWEVVDGQQRLTTIYLILNYLGKKKFQIEYATRPDSKSFLERIDKTKKNVNIDYYYISEAYRYIENWFVSKAEELDEENTFQDKFNINFGESTKVIWYEVETETNFDIEETKSADIFSRINTGKIPLTSSELIKAQFLRRDNFDLDLRKQDDEKISLLQNKIHLEQLRIASEWDKIEFRLRDNDFWYFIHKGNEKLFNRIEYIFQLMYPNKNQTNGDYKTFHAFMDKINLTIKNGNSRNKTMIDEWNKFKHYYLRFIDWFEDRNLFHLIGYLIITKDNLLKLKEKSDVMTKPDFVNYLKNEIKDTIQIRKNKEKLHLEDIRNLEYGEDDKLIEKILLLFNIITMNNNDDKSSRFPFDRYKKNSWSLEHIHAQNSEKLKTELQWKAWILAHIDSLKRIQSLIGKDDKNISIKYKSVIDKLQDAYKNKKIGKNDFELLFNEVKSLMTETNEEQVHDIGNLTLISREMNSSLGNYIFEAKRNRIIEKDKHGEYIPICTRNVFLKYYNSNIEHFYFWTNNDRNEYIDTIIDVMKDFYKGKLG